MVPAKITAFFFHTSLFVPLSGGTKFRCESPMRSKRDKAHRLFPLPPAQNLLHRTFQIVVTEHTSELQSPEKVVCSPAPSICSVTTIDRKSTRLNSSHQIISYYDFCLNKKKYQNE